MGLTIFSCDLPQLLSLSCCDTWVSELALFPFFFFWLCLTDIHFRSPCLLLLYHSSSLEDPLCWRKVQSFLHMPSHLTAVAIFQEAVFFMYFRLSSSSCLDEDKMSSLFYTLVIPMLNPLIWSLRSKDVKQALQKLKL